MSSEEYVPIDMKYMSELRQNKATWSGRLELVLYVQLAAYVEAVRSAEMQTRNETSYYARNVTTGEDHQLNDMGEEGKVFTSIVDGDVKPLPIYLRGATVPDVFAGEKNVHTFVSTAPTEAYEYNDLWADMPSPRLCMQLDVNILKKSAPHHPFTKRLESAVE